MSPKRIATFVADVYQGTHAKRLQTLSLLMTALVIVGKVGVAALGRSFASRAAPKHCIKMVERFLSNTGIAVHEWCNLLLASVLGPRCEVKIAIDWTRVGKWPVLVASVVTQRRGIPICWATCDYRTLARSQNAFEESFLAMLKDMIPRDVTVTLRPWVHARHAGEGAQAPSVPFRDALLRRHPSQWEGLQGLAPSGGKDLELAQVLAQGHAAEAPVNE